MSKPLPILIASDHAGFELKESLMAHLIEKGHEIKDLGTDSSESTDYPDYAHELSELIAHEEAKLGILICHSGIGMSIAANRSKGIRAGLVNNVEVARLVRQHNDANVLVIPGRFMEDDEAKNCVRAFIDTQFEAGRHKKRVEKISV